MKGINMVAQMDLDLVREIYRDPELFERISEEGTDRDDFFIDDEAMYYALQNPAGDVIGIGQFEFENATTLKGHCNVLAPYRKDYAGEVGKALLMWFVFQSPKTVEKLQVEIPLIYPDVIGFVTKHGFVHEGLKRLSIRKKGQLVDTWLGGITRREAFNWLVDNVDHATLSHFWRHQFFTEKGINTEGAQWAQ